MNFMKDFIPKIKIIGIGGCGSNIVFKMVNTLKDIEIFFLDTNAKALSKFNLKNKIQIGKSGIGAGAKPETGKKAFQESLENIKNILEGADLVFLIAGFGGGTGTGILPEIAKLSKELGILTISVITKPFDFEGVVRGKTAKQGLKELENNTDSYIVIDNNKLSKLAKNNLTFLQAFNLVDEFVYKVVKETVDLLTTASFINLDFADLKTIMENSGKAIISIGAGRGLNKIKNTINTSFSLGLLEDDNSYDISKASKLMLNIVASKDISYSDINSLVEQIKENLEYKEDTQVIFGAKVDENLEDEIKLTLIATGFRENKKQIEPSKQARNTKNLLLEDEFSIYDYLNVPAYIRKKYNA
ncbi:MAG: cell division protein FtsZ [Hydrogenothermus sp.]|nr:MAG: cell division protein FtsZ [Hydrogenothermus sp.]